MMNSLALSDAMLAFASIFSVFLLAQRKSLAPIHRLSCVMALFGFLLMALAATAGSLRYGVTEFWMQPHKVLTHIATYLSPPLVSLALCLGLSARAWSRSAWALMILAVLLLHGLAHRYGFSLIYRDMQLAVAIGASCYFVIKSHLELRPRIMMLAAIASYFFGGLIIGNEGTLLGYLRLDLFRYFIGLGNLLLSTGMYLALRTSYSQSEP